ncbi:MAG: hypothetical protein FIA91_11860 [Geobacter sp.]|nr:hypothetical protein [Geobacter sp.]
MGKLALVAVTILGGATLAFAAGDNKNAEKKAQAVIMKRCTSCHSAERINAAFKAGRDMNAIEHEMEKKGAKLSDKEKSTLDFYWNKAPVLKK